MVVMEITRALIFAMLACVIHSFPTKMGGGSDSGSGGPVLPGGSGLGLQGVLALSRPSAQGAPSSSSSNVLLAPGVSSYYSADAAVPNVGLAAANDPQWEVAPQSLGGPSNDGSAAGRFFAPEDTSAGFFGPSVPEFTSGELSHMENTFEHGSNDRETERQGEDPRRPPFNPGPVPGLPFAPAEGLGLSASFPGPYWYPYHDWMFLTGQYPPGTVSHFSSSFEQGKDSWHDSHYDKHVYPLPTDSPSGSAIPTLLPPPGKPVVKVGAQAR